MGLFDGLLGAQLAGAPDASASAGAGAGADASARDVNDTAVFKSPPVHLVVSASERDDGGVSAGASAVDAQPWPRGIAVPTLQAQRKFAQSLFQPRSVVGAHVPAPAATPAGAKPEARRRRCAPRCTPRLASPFPGWRSLATIALSFVLAMLLDAYPGMLAFSWAVAWPVALLAIVAESFYVVDTMDGKDPNGAVPVLGVAGLARLFDLWLAWAVTCGNIFMCFWLFDVHGKHFSGLEALSRDSSALEALSYFMPFSITACSGGGLVGLEPATAVARYAVTAFVAVTFVFVVVIIYTNAAEALIRRDRRVETG